MRKKNDPKKPLNKQDQAVWDDFVATDKKIEAQAPEDFAKLLTEMETKPNPQEKEVEKNISESVPEIIKEKKQENISTPQLDRRTAEKLRKGKIPIEARLDLHGKNQKQAYELLKKFIVRSVNDKLRCVLVITGKGKTRLSTEEIFITEDGVLKQKLPQWLEEKFFSDYILRTMPAHIKDGGSGAFYIYLKRQR